MPKTIYAADYSVLQVKQMIQRSEQRVHPQSLRSGKTGHGFALHGGITDGALQARSATMRGKNQDASAFMNSTRRIGGNLVSTDYWEALQLNDQAFIIANVLNSRFGQSALGVIDNHTLACRLTISALPFTDAMQGTPTGMAAIMNFTMRVSTSGQPVTRPTNQLIGRLTIIVEPAGTYNGYPELHFVTAYPSRSKLHGKFGIKPGVVRRLAWNGNLIGYDKYFSWNSIDQNNANAALSPI